MTKVQSVVVLANARIFTLLGIYLSFLFNRKHHLSVCCSQLVPILTSIVDIVQP